MSEMPKEPMGEEAPEKNEYSGYTDNELMSLPQGYEVKRSKEKKPIRVSLFTLLLTTVSLVLAAVMITYTVSSAYYRKQIVNIYAEEQTGEQTTEDQTQGDTLYSEKGYPFELFSQFISAYTFADTDENAMMVSALKAYVSATGDRYAFYFTADEYADYLLDNTGKSEGIGINIIYSEATVNGKSCLVIKVINVMKDSPAAAFGLRVGDLIYGVGTGENMRTVSELGHDRALSELKGVSGTEAIFTVLRPNGDSYEVIDCNIVRAPVTSESVYYRVHATDENVGIVKIIQFDLTTPNNFKAAMNDLIGKGCTKFIFDVRYNPGGDLKSIAAVLSYFLNEGDVIIRTLYKDGSDEVSKAGVRQYSGDYAGCSVSQEDIGRYRNEDFEFAVLCNESTASAAELFTATFRDYGIGTVVGTTTYGKGSMQSIFSLWKYGYDGALKLTVAKYFSGLNGGYNDGYDGIGVEPNIYCEQSEEASSKNIYELTDDEDEQLKKALEALYN